MKSFTYLNSALSPKSASDAVTVATLWPMGTDLLSGTDVIGCENVGALLLISTTLIVTAAVRDENDPSDT